MSPTEQRVAAIWEEVLGVVPVGPDDNFFHLGGHSPTAMRVIARVRERLQIELPMRTLFAEPTARGLSRVLHARFQATI
jgi:acyl carrier protein